VLRVYFASSRRGDFTESHDYYDLWVFDEFHESTEAMAPRVSFCEHTRMAKWSKCAWFKVRKSTDQEEKRAHYYDCKWVTKK
jgi:hypothetical protein